MKLTKNLLLSVALFVGSSVRAQEDCPKGLFDQVTDDFLFSASSDQGAAGEVVAVDISLTVKNLHQGLYSMGLTCCYDPSMLELIDEPVYTDIYDKLVWRSSFTKLTNGDRSGFSLGQGILKEKAAQIFPSENPVHLVTVFLRIKGVPGNSTTIEFCDSAFRQFTGACYRNRLSYSFQSEQLAAFSTLHAPGEIRILEGAPTRPNPPALPPLAKVYPEAPTAETARIRFELTGGVATPGSAEVPLDVFVTSNYEFSGFYLSITFPPEYLELARVAEHTRPGAIRSDNADGFVAVGMTNSRRRIGTEGERVRLATLYFNVKPGTPVGSDVALKFEPSGPSGAKFFFNWLAIHHQDGRVQPDPLPITAEVSPLLITNGLLLVREKLTAQRGDANLDEALDTSDAVSILGYLFLGEAEPACPGAADFDLSGALDITDPIAILSALFLGEPPLAALEPREVLCRE